MLVYGDARALTLPPIPKHGNAKVAAGVQCWLALKKAAPANQCCTGGGSGVGVGRVGVGE